MPLKVDVVLSRFQGEKKISSLPFTLWVTANVRGGPGSTSVRMGVDVPVGTSSVTTGRETPTGPRGGPNGAQTTTETASKIDYRNVGTAIDCWASSNDDGRFTVFVNVLDSSIFTTDADTKPSLKLADPMAFRTFSMSNTQKMRDGQTQQFSLASDKITGEILRVDVTLTVLK